MAFHGMTPKEVYDGSRRDADRMRRFTRLPTSSSTNTSTASSTISASSIRVSIPPASQHAQTLTILPLPELIDDLTTRSHVIWPWELTFEDFYMSPSAEAIFEGLARMMVHALDPELLYGRRLERASGPRGGDEKRD